MKIQINTDKNIEADDDLAEQVRAMVGGTLERFSERLTRVEVYLSDENSDSKFGTHDMRCVLEARVSGRSPNAVTHNSATWEQAVEGAAEKLMRSLESTLGRLDDHRQGATSQK
jgi:ribosome-associated translation inhibitor RaiA